MQSGGPEPVQPRKRGRKPGPFSRSVREAQRKLNHSIIEKARRTKTNEALAALRQLVPSDFSRRPSPGNLPSNNNRHLNTNSDDEIEDEDDKGEEDHEYYNSAAALSGTAKNGKKREEKEFKLEVLERTVAYLQVLTQRYDELKMRHDKLEMNTGDRRHSQSRCSTERRYREYREDAQNSATASRKRSRSDAGSVIAGSISNSDHGSVTLPFTVSGGSIDDRPSKRHEPLPPISSWLPHSPNATRSTLSPSTPSTKCNDECTSGAVTPVLSSQLPTPPSSALFQPLFSGAHCYATHSTIPSLSLDPKALSPPCQLHARRLSVSSSPSVTPRVLTGGRSTKPGNNNHVIKRSSHLHSERVPATDASHTSPHTPEDENAASLLLTMGLQPSPISPLGHAILCLKGRRLS
ncbi:hypothetical protein M378DRAFT_531878 [Amanita muscaria Koide BX008]|uniref:BHLH domain-containing protein n=1 Tax=Amanita muscaria (strain Koide BX008) TaxID=946122 RepID=A0A0C2WJE0_AMAMK|nr:hypothetical protein M378DRAFT_531878 [Amanita muscaria Koide BX008]